MTLSPTTSTPKAPVELSVDETQERFGSGPMRTISNSYDRERSTNGHKGLIVWQRGIQMVDAVYDLTAEFPKTELFRLSDQMLRAAISVPSNVSEGYGRKTTGEFKQFLCIARGSNCELETQLVIAKNRGFGSASARAKAESLCADVSRLLRAYLKSIEDRKA